ncbi:MAG: Spy/CpxP family protein refolding chaperone [Microcoleaceae cyanobacterium]
MGHSAFAKPDSEFAKPLIIAQQQTQGTEGFLDEINATPQQKQKILRIKNQYEGQLRASKEQLARLQRELTGLINGGAADGEIRSKHDQIVQIRQEFNQMQLEMLLKMREVLTPEQQDRLAEIMNQRRSRFLENR